VIVDSSALLAIILNEPEEDRFTDALAESAHPRMSAATLLEAAIVLEGRSDPVAVSRFDEILRVSGVQILPFSETTARIARQAWRDFGKGRHKAALNFGDCIAYATAKEAAAPLLFKGDDFPHTDIEPALKD